jgi:hypothetical protein
VTVERCTLVALSQTRHLDAAFTFFINLFYQVLAIGSRDL